MRPSPEVISSLVERVTKGEEQALSELLPVVYQELRKLSRRYLRRESNQQTLQTTALVHEAYLRLLGDQNLQWKDRAHFLGIAARSMRQILVERARARHAQKRGGVQRAVTLEDRMLGQDQNSVDLLELDEALKALAALDPKQAEVVELRFFAGLTVEETADKDEKAKLLRGSLYNELQLKERSPKTWAAKYSL